jgi:hypothetical protein
LHRDRQYNTVKNWYKRTFEDWTDEGDVAKSKDRGREQGGMQVRPQADHPPQTYSKYTQINPQNKKYYRMYQKSDRVQGQWPNSPQHGYGLPQPRPQNAIMPEPIQPDLYEYQAASQSLPQQKTLRNQGNRSALHVSTGQFFLPHQNLIPPYSSYHNVPQPLIGDVMLSYQRDHLESRGNNPPQRIPQVNEGGYPTRQSLLSQARVTINQGHYNNESGVISVNVENAGGGYPLPTPGMFSNQQNVYFNTNNQVGEIVSPHSGGQMRTMGPIAAPHEPMMGSNFHPSQVTRNINQRAYLASGQPMGQQHIERPLLQQRGPACPSANPYRSSPVLPHPAIPPQHSLLPDPSRSSAVIRKRANQPLVALLRRGTKIIMVNPDDLPKDHARKRLRSQLRDSIGVYRDQLQAPNTLPETSSPSPTTLPTTTRKPLSNQSDNPSNVSIHTNPRDSGYVSNLDLALKSLRNSFSSFQLCDDPNFEEHYTPSEDGFVELNLKARLPVRWSYIQKINSHETDADA